MKKERIKHERAADFGWPPTEERIPLPPANPGTSHEKSLVSQIGQLLLSSFANLALGLSSLNSWCCCA